MRSDNGDRLLLPAILITVGVLWLLFQIGFVPPGLVGALNRWWPLLLVGAGLDLLLPTARPAKVPFVAFAAALLLLLGLFTPGTATSNDRSVDEPLAPDTRTVTAEIETSRSPTTITATNRPTNTTTDNQRSLVRATFNGQPAGSVATSGRRDARIEIEPARGGFPFTGSGRWDIDLPASLPLTIGLDGGSGSVTLQLAQATLRRLDLDAGSGPVNARLPGNGASYEVEIDGGSGRLDLDLAPGASVDMNADFGSGGASIFVGEGSDLRLELTTGSGGVELDLPDTAPIRLEVRSDGSGRLRLPDYLNRRAGRDDTGRWESANLGNGGRVIEIRIHDVGSGNITIR